MCKLLPLLCFLLGLTVWCARLDTKAAEEATVYISVERFTVGQGYIVKPTKVTTTKGTPVSELVEKVLKEEGYVPDVETNSSYGWYLAGIHDTDNGKTRVPVSVMELAPDLFSGDYRTGILPSSENYAYPELAEFSYQMDGNSTGWFYYVNNTGPGYSMSNYEASDQDVIRIQFTMVMGDLAKVPDIDEATKALAIMKDYLRASDDAELSAIYDDSLFILSDMDAEKEDVLQVQELLMEISKDLADGSKDKSYAECQKDMREINDKTKAHDVELRIGLLPEAITLEDQILVEDTQALFDALSLEQQNRISSEDKRIISSASETIRMLKEAAAKKAKEEADKKAASQVTAKINAIGTVTLDKESVISAARKAYDALNPDAKKRISSSLLAKLTAAEARIASLKKEAALKKKYTPVKAKITKVKPGKKKVKLTWKKIKSVTGYQVWMSTKKSSGYKKIATIKKAKSVTFTKKKLKSKKKYYFRIRAYRKVGKTTYYGAYSTVKMSKVK